MTTVNPAEVDKFNALAATWWDANGAMKPLHAFNPIRITALRRELCVHFNRADEGLYPLQGLRILDIGCGGGLVSEPLARLGATVLGIDAAEKNIGAAMAHARDQSLTLTYRHTTAETLLAENPAPFDAVLALEIIEHVANPALFVATCAKLVTQGGLLAVSTLNRTLKSLLLGKIGAEYILGWLPRGTHSWKQFLKPSEVQAMATPHDMQHQQSLGFAFNPTTWQWQESKNLDVNYLLLFRKNLHRTP